MAWIFSLIARVHRVLHRVSCSYETIPNAPKYYKRSNGVDWVRSLQKIPTSLRGTNFNINCTNSPYFAPSFMQLRNDPKCTKILWRSNGVDWVRSLRKIQMLLRGTNFCINSTVQSILHQVSCGYEMIPNAPKHYETHQNMSLGSNGVDQVHLLGKITTWLYGTNFCINYSSSICFAPSFMQLRNDP